MKKLKHLLRVSDRKVAKWAFLLVLTNFIIIIFNLGILLPKQLCTQQHLRRDEEGKAERFMTQAYLCPRKHWQESRGKHIAHTLEIIFKCPVSWGVLLLPLCTEAIFEFIQPRKVHTKATCVPLTVYNFGPFPLQPVLEFVLLYLFSILLIIYEQLLLSDTVSR